MSPPPLDFPSYLIEERQHVCGLPESEAAEHEAVQEKPSARDDYDALVVVVLRFETAPLHFDVSDVAFQGVPNGVPAVNEDWDSAPAAFLPACPSFSFSSCALACSTRCQ